MYNDFPIPTVVFPEPLPQRGLATENSTDAASRSPNAIISSQQTEKATIQGSSPPELPNNTSIPVIPDSQNSANAASEGTLPPQLLSFYTNLKSNLTNSFPEAPPYTVQRFAELVLHPTAHYRTLPTYLRALDRTISVSSPSNVFPIPSSGLNAVSASINGTPVGVNLLAATAGSGLADDFNGAALTPIPWLRDSADMLDSPERPLEPRGGMGVGPIADLRTESTSVIDGPNGTGSIETVTVAVNGVPSVSAGVNTAQQHLSAGLTGGVTGSSLRPSNAATSAVTEAPQPQESSSGALPRSPRSNDDDEDERPRARGPEEIGMEDMGPQGHFRDGGARGLAAGPAGSLIDAEKAMGRPGEGEVVGGHEEKAEATEGSAEEANQEVNNNAEADAEGDADAMSLDGSDKENKSEA